MNISKKILQWLVVGLAITLAGCGNQATAPAPVNTPKVTATASNLPVNVDVATVQQLRQRGDVILLDVREKEEYAAGHISKVVLIPLGQLPNRLSEIPKDKVVIAICRSGHRSGQATELLRQKGFTQAHSMQGGMNAWQQAGYEIEK